MIRTPAFLSLVALASAFLHSAPRADSIRKTDGKVIEDVTILEETLAHVTYRKSGNQLSVPSEDVLRVSFEKLPRLLDEAEAMLADQDLVAALDNYDLYVDGWIKQPNPRERQRWAPAYAAWRAVELRIELADLEGVIAAANRLIQNFPDSRYLPGAFHARAIAQYQSDKAGLAQRTLSDLEGLIAAKGLSRRWQLECRLAKIETDPTMSGVAKREQLADIVAEADGYPTVRSRAYVVEGESYLQEAERNVENPDRAQKLRDQAKEVFERIIGDFTADEETLAGAYSGLGDCLFYSGAGKLDKELLHEAVMNYLRVVTLYKSQSRYVPRCLYHAMRSFDLLDEGRRKFDMKTALLSRYPRSRWAAEAEKH